MMLQSNNLFKSFREDVPESCIAILAYVDTFFWKQFIDMAGQIVPCNGTDVLEALKSV